MNEARMRWFAYIAPLLLAGCIAPEQTGSDAADDTAPSGQLVHNGTGLPDTPIQMLEITADGRFDALLLRLRLSFGQEGIPCQSKFAAAYETDGRLDPVGLSWWDGIATEAVFTPRHEQNGTTRNPPIVEVRVAGHAVMEGDASPSMFAGGVESTGRNLGEHVLTWAVTDIRSWDADLTDGHAFLFRIECEEPFEVLLSRMGDEVHIHGSGDGGAGLGVRGLAQTEATQWNHGLSGSWNGVRWFPPVIGTGAAHLANEFQRQTFTGPRLPLNEGAPAVIESTIPGDWSATMTDAGGGIVVFYGFDGPISNETVQIRWTAT